MMNFLSVEQGSRPSRPVVIRPAGDGLAAPLAGATQWSAWKRKEFVPRGMRAAQGKLFSLEGCSHRSPATARIHKQTGRLGPTRSERKHGRLGSPRDGFTGLRPDTGKDNAQRQGESVPDVAGGLLLEAWRGSSIARPGGGSVNRPS
ncbi:hypothetical protein ACSGCD_03530 [Enterobacter hormaechei]|uniref:hypothetical protein n=1 Tax=Enterobacter hormaechei TaxID=158836 RepID=UPI0005EEE298|nr:hypothetical protein [Enterobacter hormaechei]KJN49405.1 hypothetical protein SS51_25380 [Enterobacter roggenkampii]MDK5118953.1 hypothetical protein [Enterobacter hormaechei]RDT55736.1 hypothetical protein DXF93_06040 [Escherichia coli]HCS4210536.1 hypothetical protein [Enterobacter hormaechei]